MDWTKAKPDLIEQVVKEGERYLDGQLKLATSADQRAAVLAGVFTAAATGVLVGLVSLSTTKDSVIAHTYPVYLGGFVMAALFLLAGSLCTAAVMPVGFWLPGNQPDSWYRDVEQGRELAAALSEEAEHIQSKIEDNRSTLGKNAWRFKWGARLGIAAPFAGAALWAVTSSSWWFGA